MQEVYVLDADLEYLGVVDIYTSLIWASRYSELGDFELYVPATTAALDMLQIGRFVALKGSDMVCQIERIELTTDAENGNYLNVTGSDTKKWLDSRIVWTTMQSHGKAEVFVREMVNSALGSDADVARQMIGSNGQSLFGLGTLQGFDTALTTQVSYKNVGEKVREYCLTYGWGYRFVLDNAKLLFEIYKGVDRSQSVIFSPRFDNLISSTYSHDETNIGNVALIAGEGQGSERKRVNAGVETGLNRHEIYVDAKDISRSITYGELVSTYPGGAVQQSGDIYEYIVPSVDIQIIDDAQLARLQDEYPGGSIVTVDGVQYYRISDADIATCGTASPASEDTVELGPLIYDVYLLIRGYEKMAEYGAVTVFDGTIQPDITFIYGQDYFLGDIVKVENQFGISADARIVEVIEVYDENGHSVEPKFEYISQEG